MSARRDNQLVPGLTVIELDRAGMKELFITATPHGGGDLRRLFAQVQRVVDEAGATVLAADVFGGPAAPGDEPAKLAGGGGAGWPITWLEAGPGGGLALTGIQVHAVTGTTVQRIEMNGRVIGTVFDDGFARHCQLRGLRAEDRLAPREQQARATFELLETALRSAGMEFGHVVRTWFYLDQILSWYDLFNQVRNEFFHQRNVFAGLVPASTGIGSANAARAALVGGAYAVQPRAGRAKVTAVPSPLQCPALEYGSSFSRAVEVEMPDQRRLLVSGTASIEPGGRTVHRGELAGQAELTMQVTAAILESRGMSWQDVTRAVAYIKQGSQAGLFRARWAAAGLGKLPLVITENDICRDDLLCEIELDAVRQTP